MLRLVGPLTEGSHPRCHDVGIYCIGVDAVVVAVADDYVAAAVVVDGVVVAVAAVVVVVVVHCMPVLRLQVRIPATTDQVLTLT